MKNPFSVRLPGGPRNLQIVDAHDRIEAVEFFTLADCRNALLLPDLQKTVRTAIERKMRKLERKG